MKHSIYNNLIELTSKYDLLYNSYSDTFIILSKKQSELISSNTFEEKDFRSDILYNKLIDAGCLINNEINEIDQLSNRINNIDNNKLEYLLTINPTINCNFKCWYCYENHLVNSKMTPDVLNRIKKHIAKSSKNKHLKSFTLSFFGGEPLLYYKDLVHPLLLFVNETFHKEDLDFDINFTSNGYLITNKMVSELKDNHVSSFQITLDGDRENHNKVRFPYKGGNSYDQIINNVKLLISSDIKVILRINYTKDNIRQSALIAKDFETLKENVKENLRLDFQRVWQDDTSKNTFPDEWLDDSINTFLDLGIATTRRNMDMVLQSCYADKTNQALINYDGNVYKCTARDFTEDNCLGYLDEAGEIIWDQSKLMKRCNLRFKKEICYQCSIAPLCGGGCTQQIMENKNNQSCTYHYTEKQKEQVVLDRFYNNLVKGYEIPF